MCEPGNAGCIQYGETGRSGFKSGCIYVCTQSVPDNPAMQKLRNAWILARLVLAWFALSVAVAAAAPLVNPQSIELLCSGSGAMKVLVKSADGTPAPAVHSTMDCPLCASAGAPPPVAFGAAAPPQPLALALQPIPAARIAARTAAPLPARGPPLTLSI
jgi:hypothetical protein